jgi:hypothetical protein
MREDDGVEFQRALKALLGRYPEEQGLAVLFKALLDLYPKGRALAALSQMPIRSGPKRDDDSSLLILMGRHMTWRRNLSLRETAKIATQHLPDDQYRLSVIDRIRRKFAEQKAYYLMVGKLNEILYLIMAQKRGACPNEEEEKTTTSEEPWVQLRVPDDDALEAKFQELRLAMGAVYTCSDTGAMIVFPKLGGIQGE